MKVEDVMSVNPLYVGAGEHITRAREIMRDNAIQCLPVLRAGKYEGMVTIQDIINVTSTKSDVTVEGYLRQEVPTLSPSTDLAKAARAIIGTEEGRMAVLEDGGKLAGILSIKDIFEGIEMLGIPDMPVRDVMTRKVVVATADDPISEVWRNMTEFGLFGFPVVRLDQTVIGIITRVDIVRRGYVRFARENEFIKTPSTVQKIMTTPAVTIDENESVRTAAKVFVDRDISRMPVTGKGKLTGIVDRYDVLKVCGRLVTVE
jgi:CBS domain-containing protein